MSAIIAARGDNPRFNSRRRNDGSAGRPVLRHAARRFRRRRNQGGAAGNRRPVTRRGSAVRGQRIRLLSRGESQQAIHYSQLRSSARRGSVAETPRKRRRFYCQPTVAGLASKARHRSGFALCEISTPRLLQHHRLRIHGAESGHARLRHSRASGGRPDEFHGGAGRRADALSDRNCGHDLRDLCDDGNSYLNENVSPKRWGNAHPNIVPDEAYRGSDDKYFVVGVGTEALWKRFVQLMNIQDDIGRDDRFTTNALRIKHREMLVPLLQNIFQQKPAATWLDKFTQSDIPAAPINTVAEAIEDRQTRARGLIVQLEHPAIGTAKSIANPILFSGTPVSYRLPPPLLGEHTSAILQSLGYAAKDIKHMAVESAI